MRPAGSKNYLPSQHDQKQMLKRLREQANHGDPVAAGVLLVLAERHREAKHA